MDEDRERVRRVRDGEVVVAPAGKDNPRTVPHGLIHDWIGVVFVPHATLAEVLHVVNGYDRYHEYYRPFVVRSRLLNDDGNKQTFGLVFVRKEFGVTAALDMDMDAQTIRLDEAHAYKYSFTTRVQAIEHIGTPNESKGAIDSGPGYLWRLVTVSRLEQRDGGVYLEMETTAMSRAIPFALRWLIQSLTEQVPRDLATGLLRSTRDAVSLRGRSQAAGTCERAFKAVASHDDRRDSFELMMRAGRTRQDARSDIHATCSKS